MIMGCKWLDNVSSFNPGPDQWPYGNLPIFALSKSVVEPPENARKTVEMYSGQIPVLVARLTDSGYRHAYADGGTTITSFISYGLLEDMIITQAPILLGEKLHCLEKSLFE